MAPITPTLYLPTRPVTLVARLMGVGCPLEFRPIRLLKKGVLGSGADLDAGPN